MDVAASEFFRSGKYDLDFKSPDDPSRHISGEQLGDLYRSFIKGYPGNHAHPPPQPIYVKESVMNIIRNVRIEFLILELYKSGYRE